MKATIYRRGLSNHFNCNLSKEAYDTIASREIVFDQKNLMIRIPCFDDTKTFRISDFKKKCGGVFSFFHTSSDVDDISGKYMLEKDGDWYVLVEIE